jgi:uncharacterized membrane protein YesL
MIQIILGFIVVIVVLLVLPYLVWYKPELIQSIKDMLA